jgi:hypothetical protein
MTAHHISAADSHFVESSARRTDQNLRDTAHQVRQGSTL